METFVIARCWIRNSLFGSLGERTRSFSIHKQRSSVIKEDSISVAIAGIGVVSTQSESVRFPQNENVTLCFHRFCF